MLSITEATSRGIIKRGTGIELLEAQAATGNLIDPKTAKKMSVKEAYKSGNCYLLIRLLLVFAYCLLNQLTYTIFYTCLPSVDGHKSGSFKLGLSVDQTLKIFCKPNSLSLHWPTQLVY